MPSAVENMGWVFSMKDLASGVVLKLEKNVDGVAKGISLSTDKMVTKTERSMGVFGESTERASRALKDRSTNFTKALSEMTSAAIKSLPIANLVKKMAEGLGTTKFGIKKMAFAPTDMKEFVEAAERLGVPLERMNVMFERIREAAGRLHPSMGELQTAAKGLGVSFAEFRDLMTKPQEFQKYSFMAKALGMSMKQLAEYVEMVRDSFEASGDQANTYASQLSMLRGSVGSFAKGGLGMMGKGAALALGFEGVEALFGFLKGVFSPFLDTLRGTVEAVFAPLKQAFYELSVQIAPILSAVLTPLVKILAQIVGEITKAVGSSNVFATIFKTISSLMEKLGPVLTSIFGPLSTQLEDSSGLIAVFTDLFTTLADSAGPILEALVTAFREIASKMGPVLVDVLKEVAGILKVIVVEQADMMKEMIVTTLALLDAFMPMIPPLVKIVAILTKFFVLMNVKALNMMMKVWLLLGQAIAFVVKPLAQVLGYLMKIAAPWIEEFLSGIVSVFDALYKIVWKVGSVALKAYIVYVKILVGVGALLVKAIGGIAKKFSDVIGLTKLLGDAWYVLTSAFEDGWNWLAKIPDKIKGAWKSLVSFGRVMVEIVRSMFTRYIDGFKKMVGSVLDFLGLGTWKAKAAGIFEGLKAFVAAPIETLKKWINTYIIDFLNKFMDAELPIVGRIGDILNEQFGISKIPELRHGGIATAPTFAAVGEVPEVIAPLTPEGISKFVGGLLPRVETKEQPPLKLDRDALDMLRKAVGLLEKIVEQGDSDGGSAPVLESL